MLYVWAAIAIAILFLVWQIIRWWNLPKTIEARRKAQESRSKAWADWRANRPRLFGRWRQGEKATEEKPVLPPKGTPPNSTEVVPLPPAQDTAEALRRIEKPRRGLGDGPLRRRIRERRK